jgi:hypothetical protein
MSQVKHTKKFHRARIKLAVDHINAVVMKHTTGISFKRIYNRYREARGANHYEYGCKDMTLMQEYLIDIFNTHDGYYNKELRYHNKHLPLVSYDVLWNDIERKIREEGLESAQRLMDLYDPTNENSQLHLPVWFYTEEEA